MKKLIEALHTIQDTCKKTDDCEDCPCFDEYGGKCAVTALEPDNWKINDEVQRVLL